MQFYFRANPEEKQLFKKLVDTGNNEEAWKVLQQVLQTELNLSDIKENKNMNTADLADIIYSRLERAYPDVVSKYGLEVVGDAILRVANFYAGDVEELGTSDIGAMAKAVLRDLESNINFLGRDEDIESKVKVDEARASEVKREWERDTQLSSWMKNLKQKAEQGPKKTVWDEKTKTYKVVPVTESEDQIDTVTVDIPLLIRMLEYAREDAKDDMDLHDATERLIAAAKKGTLTMKDYDKIFGDQKEMQESDISGLLAASKLNRSFIITAQTAEGQTKKFRVKAQSPNVAKEKFSQHYSMAKILDVKEEGVTEGSNGQQWSKKDEERLRRAVAELDDIFGTPDDSWTKSKQNQIKQRIKTNPMSGPKSKLPEQGVAEGLSWSSLDEGLSAEDKMSIFEEFHTKGNLTESLDEDKRKYFESLMPMSDTPSRNEKYIVVPLSLVGNKILPLDKPALMKFLGKTSDGQLAFRKENRTVKYPSATMRDISVFNTFTFSTQEAYDKFRTALSLKFDIVLPNVHRKDVAEGFLNEFAPDGFNGGDDSNDLELYLNVAKKLNMKKYKPSTAHALIAKKMAELVDTVDDEKVDWARHMARKAQGLPSMLDQQGVAEGAPELVKAEMPLVRHIEQELAQHGYEKGTPEYDQMFKHAMAYYRKFGNIDAIKKGVAEGSENSNAIIYDNGYVKIDGKMYKAKRINHESGMGIAIQTPNKMYFSPIENEYEMPSVTIHRALRLGGLKPTFNEGVAEGLDNVPATLYHATYRPLLKSIKKYGLGGDRAQAKWEDSVPGVVYLALDKNVAESYAEASEVIPEEWLDEIVILKISTNGLDKNKFSIDSNVQDNTGDTLEYHGIIPVSNIKLVRQGVAEGVSEKDFDLTYDNLDLGSDTVQVGVNYHEDKYGDLEIDQVVILATGEDVTQQVYSDEYALPQLMQDIERDYSIKLDKEATLDKADDDYSRYMDRKFSESKSSILSGILKRKV